MARRRFQRADQADSDCTPAPDGNKPLLTTQDGGAQTLTGTSVQAQMATMELSFTMAAGDPGGGENLGASSLFTVSLDVTAIGANQTVTVEFHALDAGCTSQGSIAATGSITATGVQELSRTWDPPVADRYQVRILLAQGGMMTDPDEDLVLRTNNTDAWLDIPDAPVAGARRIMVVT